MKAMDLFRKSQDEFTQSENLGVSESIEFYHKTTLLKEYIRAFVSSNLYNEPVKNRRVIEAKFSSVKLVEEPAENDEITYDSKIYKVKDWVIHQGRYIINATYQNHHTGKKIKVSMR